MKNGKLRQDFQFEFTSKGKFLLNEKQWF